MKRIFNFFKQQDYRLDLNKCQILFMEFSKDHDVSHSILELETTEGKLLSELIMDYFKKEK